MSQTWCDAAAKSSGELTFMGLRLTDLDLMAFLVEEYSLECLRASMAVFKLLTQAQF